MSDSFAIPERVLIVAAHPDDAEFGCGGTIAKWASLGCAAMCVVATNGDKGDDSGVLSPEQLASRREGEQRKASAELGVVAVQFLGYSDGELISDHKLRADIVKWIRKWKPEAVFTHDPAVLFHAVNAVNHSDHRAIGQATVDAVYPYARGAHQYPEHASEGLAPHFVGDLYVWGSEHPNHWEDVTESIDIKVRALQCHTSQFESELTRDFVQSHLVAFGDGENKRYAECFRRVTFV